MTERNKIYKSLLEKSVEKKDFKKAAAEWQYLADRPPPEVPIEGVPDKELKTSGICLCGQPFKTGFRFRNTENGNEIWVGTTCMKIIQNASVPDLGWTQSYDESLENSKEGQETSEEQGGSTCLIM